MANKNSSHHTIGINKFSFYTLLSMAVLYMISIVLSFFEWAVKVVSVLQGVATAVALCIVAYIAWRYVANKTISWKILYLLVLLIVLVGIIIPLI